MKKRRLLLWIPLLLVLATIVGIIAWYALSLPANFKVIFLDVGQGDAIFIQTPDRYQILIDSGPDASVMAELGRVMMPWDRTLDAIIATHPDKDHIGGFPDILDHYQVALVIDNGFSEEKKLAQEYRTLVKDEGSAYIAVSMPKHMILPDGVTLEFLRNDELSHFDTDTNDGSVALRVTYQDISFLLTGDAGTDVEESLIRDILERLDIDVLKLGHHGSKTSTSEEFLQATTPKVAVISAGLNNRYGHPHAEVTDRLDALHILYVCTCDKGRIVFSVRNGVLQAK